MTIVEFLEARIAEREALARAAQTAQVAYADAYGNTAHAELVALGQGEGAAEAAALFAATMTPEVVLAECATMRKIIEFEVPVAPVADALRSATPAALVVVQPAKAGTQILRLMAGLFADHPDYQDEWR